MNDNRNLGPVSSNPVERNNQYESIKGLHPTGYYEDEIKHWASGEYKPQYLPQDEGLGVPDWVNNHNYGRHSYMHPRHSAPQTTKKPDRVMLLLKVGAASLIGLLVVLGVMIILGVWSNPSSSPVAVAQPDSASQVAAKLHCTGFKSGDIGQSGMVISAGTCSKGGTKYAIDTFASKDVRDTWLNAAEKLGVNPKWETATSVTYKSVG